MFCLFFFFFFKQKTAYEILTCDWSSDVCSSDLHHGQCEVEVSDGEISLKFLAVTLRGFSKVHWTESRNVGARLGPYTQHFMSGSEYLREKKMLSQPRMGADRVTLREGSHQFPFSFILPTG